MVTVSAPMFTEKALEVGDAAGRAENNADISRVSLEDEALFGANESAKHIVVVVDVIDDDTFRLNRAANHRQKVELKYGKILAGRG
jgi:hypothetical protein